EALLFGQAGLLDPDTDVAGKCVDKPVDDYLQSLRREYEFLRKKYQLQPLEAFLFKKLRTRPVNFPHVRIAQISAVWIKNDLLFSKVLETDHIGDLRALFNVAPSGYWTDHYHFRSVSVSKRKPIGKNASDIILINTVIPVLFAYGKYKNLPEYCEKALGFLEELSPERNSIVTVFSQAGVSVRNAGDTQALIQLRREYCDKKKCLYCRIGFRVIGN
ncbi:MAG: DUF2851 family protein, partial [Tannerella sp.]|nr:DUF2851 family protein [Tannerella sp.]